MLSSPVAATLVGYDGSRFAPVVGNILPGAVIPRGIRLAAAALVSTKKIEFTLLRFLNRSQ
ncbi:hypothetical protein YA35_13705 [Klebsiella aerogenes]|nr:hypothetical protein YA35_13705 [Klebsiella aerogenes]